MKNGTYLSKRLINEANQCIEAVMIPKYDMIFFTQSLINEHSVSKSKKIGVSVQGGLVANSEKLNL